MPMRTLAQQRPVHHPLFARVYARVGHLLDAEIADHRRRLLAGLTGQVLEVGAGNGLNFPHYPVTVTEVLAVEPEPYLRRLALAAARQAPVPIRVVDGTAEALPAPDGAVDAVVASLVLCTVADPDRALAEVDRVLRPGGRLRFYEHVRAEDPRLARWQDRLERPWGVAGRRLPSQPGHRGGHYRRRVAGGPAGPVRPQGHAAAGPPARPRGGRARVLARGARKGGNDADNQAQGPAAGPAGPDRPGDPGDPGGDRVVLVRRAAHQVERVPGARSHRVGAALHPVHHLVAPRGVRPHLPTNLGAVAGGGIPGRRRSDRPGRLPDRRRGVEPGAGRVDLRRR